MTKPFKLGCDPEIFLQDAAGALIASCDRIGGTKEFPRPLPIGEGFGVQEDNVAIEFNIPPAGSEDDFDGKIQQAIDFLSNMVNQQGLFFNHTSAQYFPPEQLVHPAALEFGCDPDFNAWTNGRVNPKPKAENWTLRSAGGHVHVGIDAVTKDDIHSLVKLSDLMLAVPSTIQDQGFLRKSLYGKKGAFRYKPYGFEYRVLSNYWVFDAKLRRWVWNTMGKVIESFEAGMRVDHEEEAIDAAVNHNDPKAAQYLINKYNLTLAEHA